MRKWISQMPAVQWAGRADRQRRHRACSTSSAVSHDHKIRPGITWAGCYIIGRGRNIQGDAIFEPMILDRKSAEYPNRKGEDAARKDIFRSGLLINLKWLDP